MKDFKTRAKGAEWEWLINMEEGREDGRAHKDPIKMFQGSLW